MTFDADRPTLSNDGLRAAASDVAWRPVQVVASTGSTNADAAARAAAGAAEGLVIAADEQTAGRGRLGRSWVSPPGASVSVSVLLRPALAPDQLGWLPLLTGLAVAAGVSEATGVATQLKWPNDVLAAGGKIAGVLLERTADAAIVGFGINTAMTAAELPVPEASSVLLAGGDASDPDALVAACLRQLHRRYGLLTAAGDAERCGLAAEYRSRCGTIGRQVVADLPSGEQLPGHAVDVDAEGRLVIATAGRPWAVAAGDIRHLR